VDVFFTFVVLIHTCALNREIKNNLKK